MYKILCSPVNGGVQIELTTADDETFISLVFSAEQADALRQQLHDSLKLTSTGDPKSVDIETPNRCGGVDTFKISRELFEDCIVRINRGDFIPAIKSVRAEIHLGLFEAKSICDVLREDLKTGNLGKYNK